MTFTDLGGGSTQVVFSRLPATAADMKAMLAAYDTTPQFAPAAFVAAMCHSADSISETLDMVGVLLGPESLSAYDRSFLKDRVADGKTYKPFSYFAGATPENNYTPSEPFTAVVSEISNTWDESGYARFVMQSSGADSARPITVRKKASTGEWFLYNVTSQGLLADIRKPASQDVWG